MSDELVMAAEDAAKNARRAMMLTMLAVAVAILVLAIDNGIKRAIVTEAKKMRAMLDEVQAIAQEVKDGASQARNSGNDPGNSVNGNHDLVRDLTAGTVLDKTEVTAKPVPAKRPSRPAGRSPGNG